MPAIPAVNHDLPELTDDMKPADIVEELRRLPFRGGASTTIKLDRGVTTYLIRLLEQTKSVGR